MKDWKLAGNEGTRVRESHEKIREHDQQAQKLTRELVELRKASTDKLGRIDQTKTGTEPVRPQRLPTSAGHSEPAQERAAEHFRNVADAARTLRQLTTKSDGPVEKGEAATVANHVTAPKVAAETAFSARAQGATLPTSPQLASPTTFVPPTIAARAVVPERKVIKGEGKAREPSADNRANEKQNTVTANAAAQAAATESARAAGKKDEPAKSDEREELATARADVATGNHTATAGRTPRDLHGGLSADVGSGGGHESTEGHTALPTTAPGFLVLNEFDPARPGAAEMKSKWQILDRLVLKEGVHERLAEIAELDQRLTLEMMPLAERVLTEHPELKDQISTANFMRNVYGGSHC